MAVRDHICKTNKEYFAHIHYFAEEKDHIFEHKIIRLMSTGIISVSEYNTSSRSIISFDLGVAT